MTIVRGGEGWEEGGRLSHTIVQPFCCFAEIWPTVARECPFAREVAIPNFWMVSPHLYMLVIFKSPEKATLDIAGFNTEAADTPSLPRIQWVPGICSTVMC